MRDAAPIRRRRRQHPAEAPPPEPEPKPEPGPQRGTGSDDAEAGAQPPPRPQPTPPIQPAPRPKPPLRPGQFADLDRRTAERLRRGQIALDGRLDLHGMTQAAAHDALHDFLLGASERGQRCVLVITGKGRAGEEAGVLRRQVPHWLNMQPLRGRIVAIAEAQPRHGGAGALYVLLKRKRG
jgi:DNA-nicking Smr family endonuclease